MTLRPGSAAPHEGVPSEYAAAHDEDGSSRWGWHGAWGRWSLAGGWISVAVILLLSTSTNYQRQYIMALYATAAVVVVLLGRGHWLRRRERLRQRLRRRSQSLMP